MGIGTPNDEVQLLASKLRCKSGSLPFSYLGLPVGGKVRSKQLWNPVVANFKSKLSMWKRNYLSLGGRITLIKASLSNLPVYYMSLLRMPVAVREQLDRLRREFLWGGRST